MVCIETILSYVCSKFWKSHFPTPIRVNGLPAHASGLRSPQACWARSWWRHGCRRFGCSSEPAGRGKRWEQGLRCRSLSAPAEIQNFLLLRQADRSPHNFCKDTGIVANKMFMSGMFRWCWKNAENKILYQNVFTILKEWRKPSYFFAKIIYYYNSKELSSLYFGLDVFCQFEPRVSELGAVYTCTAVPVFLGRGCVSNSYDFSLE